MKNFVIQYQFENLNAGERFKKEIESEFKRLKKEKTDEYTYYLVGEYNLPALQDTINNIIQDIQFNALIRTGDFVAVYFVDDFEPEWIKREMVFGKENYLETHMKKSYIPQHESLLNDLLSYDFLKHQA